MYAQEHPEIGYRQGMHEIASFLLFVLELEHQEHPDHILFNPILPICYALLERTLNGLTTAYDATGGKSLQQMSMVILGKILQNDPALYHHLTNNPNIPPPPIYCTRWVRLMFSREVVGYENVFALWDVFFSYANIMHSLEIASAGRILLLRDALLQPDSNSLDLLMNVPPLSDITPLTATLQRLMRQKEGDHPVPVPQMFPSVVLAKERGGPFPQTVLQPPQYPGQAQFPPLIPMGHDNVYNPTAAESMMVGENSKSFSFTKMRQSFGQKVESMGQKLVTKTNEWKEAAAKRENTVGSFSGSSQSFDPLAGLRTHSMPIDAHHSGHNPDVMHRGMQQREAAIGAALQQPKSPRQFQHERWSQLLQQKIITVQEFLMALEAKESEGTVPKEIWEALADMDRMQRELLNYSRTMSAPPY
jgi:TBC1 domain family protein 5